MVARNFSFTYLPKFIFGKTYQLKTRQTKVESYQSVLWQSNEFLESFMINFIQGQYVVWIEL